MVQEKEHIDWVVPQYNLDFSIPITREQKNLEVYNRKFWLVDEAIRKGVIKRDEVITMIDSDMTMWTYFWLGEKLYWYQDMIASDTYKFKIFCAANQIGKSYLLCLEAIRTFVRNHGYGFNRAIVSNSIKQATSQMNRIKNLLRKMDLRWRDEKGDTDNIMTISLDKFDSAGKYLYTNYLRVVPANEGILGYDLHAIDLDEFDFWENTDQKNFFFQYAQPRTYATNGQISIYSNPNGRENFMWELWNQKLKNGKHKWHRYNFNIWDKPGMTQERYDEIVAGLESSYKDKRFIESTLLAIFSSGEGSYFTWEEVQASYDDKLTEKDSIGRQTFWFLDVGAKSDSSVLVGGYVEPNKESDQLFDLHIFKFHVYPSGYPLYRVVGSKSAEEINDGWHYEKSVKDYLSECDVPPIFGYDATGNLGMESLFNSTGIYPQDIIFSGPAKSGYYQKFKFMMEKRLLHRVKCDEFEKQCMTLDVKKSQRGYLMIHHKNEDDHDDVPDAVAGLCSLATDNNVMVGLSIITPSGKRIRSDGDYRSGIKDAEKELENSKIPKDDIIGKDIETIYDFLGKQRRDM